MKRKKIGSNLVYISSLSFKYNCFFGNLYVCIHLCVWVYVCVCVCMYVYVYVCVCVGVGACMSVSV